MRVKKTCQCTKGLKLSIWQTEWKYVCNHKKLWNNLGVAKTKKKFVCKNGQIKLFTQDSDGSYEEFKITSKEQEQENVVGKVESSRWWQEAKGNVKNVKELIMRSMDVAGIKTEFERKVATEWNLK